MSILDNDHIDPEVVQVDPAKDYLAELVGEGKTYKDPSALARAAAEKEVHIRRLEAEAQRMRDDLKAAQTTKRMEDMLNQLADLQKVTTPSNVDNQPTERNDVQAITADDIEKIIAAREVKKAQSGNQQTVKQRLIEEYGGNYSARVIKQAQELGVGVDFLDSVALQNPTAFYKLMGMTEAKVPSTDAPFAPPRSRVEVFQPQSNTKNWNYYEALRKSDPVKYHSRETQWEMDREAIRQAERFYD